MYTTILCLLVAVAVHSLSPHEVADRLRLQDIALLALIFGATWLLIRLRFRHMMVSALNSATRADRLRPAFTRALLTGQTIMLLPFGVITFATHYPALAVHPLGQFSEMLAGALGLLPLLLLWLVLWREAYPLHVVLFGRSGTRWSFVGGHARMNLPLIAPWLLVVGLGDLFRHLWPSGYAHMQAHPVLELLYIPLFLVGVSVLLPVLVQSLWGCEPLEAGPVRARLETLLEKQKVRVRRILLWPIMEGKILTAGVVGPMARFRYLLLTPAIIRVLGDRELDAVVAHEAGHVRHHHLWFYLLFFAGFLVSVVAVYFRLAVAAAIWVSAAWPGALEGDPGQPWLSIGFSGGLIALLIVAFRFGFGMVSRAFERQADLFALESLGDAGPLVTALETIGLHSGNIRDLPSWHHGSIAERSQFLADAARDPSLIDEHHRWVGRIRRTLMVLLCLTGVLAALLQLPPLDTTFTYAAAESGLTHRLKNRPDDVEGWLELGYIRFERGREGPAVEAYREALGRAPTHPEALNALAWLHATAKSKTFRDPERAIFLARRALRARPDQPAPHILDTLAEAHFADGDAANALRTIDLALSLLAEDASNRAYYEGQRQRFLAAIRSN